jgi:hypothetical protein
VVDFASLLSLLGNRALFTLTVSGVAVELRVVRFTGTEALSGGYEFRIELCGPEVELASLVGKDALLTIESIDTPRHVHGILAEVQYIGESRQLLPLHRPARAAHLEAAPPGQLPHLPAQDDPDDPHRGL